MKKDELLALSDWILATLYSEWSEETYRASWYSGGEEEFVSDALLGKWRPKSFTLERPYEREGVAKMRKLLEETK